MDELEKLYDLAYRENVPVISTSLESDKSMIAKEGELCLIALDKDKIVSRSDERVCLMHELGHHKTNSYYNAKSTKDERWFAEFRANKWQFKNFLPFDKIQKLVSKGYCEEYELAEELGFTQEFVHAAIAYYELTGLRLKRYKWNTP